LGRCIIGSQNIFDSLQSLVNNGFAISIEVAFGVAIFEAAEDLIGQNEDRFERNPGVMAAQKNFEEISKEIYENSVVGVAGVEPTEMRKVRATVSRR
jgi:hypothetical protein